MSAFQNQYATPEVWLASCRTVAFVFGARSRGVSPSKPSSTCSFANSGRYFSTGSSRSSLPSSTSCSAAVVATILVIEAIRNVVSGVTVSEPPATRGPAAPS